jgi:hypothetical protein
MICDNCGWALQHPDDIPTERKLGVRNDANLNPAARDRLQSLPGAMASSAEQQPIPPRFTAESDPNRPAFIITDTETGRQATVPLFAYGAARAMLVELFA